MYGTYDINIGTLAENPTSPVLLKENILFI